MVNALGSALYKCKTFYLTFPLKVVAIFYMKFVRFFAVVNNSAPRPIAIKDPALWPIAHNKILRCGPQHITQNSALWPTAHNKILHQGPERLTIFYAMAHSP